MLDLSTQRRIDAKDLTSLSSHDLLGLLSLVEKLIQIEQIVVFEDRRYSPVESYKYMQQHIIRAMSSRVESVFQS
jgi:hypothetical protein